MARIAEIEPDLRSRLVGAAAIPGLELLVLFGSRSRGDVRPGSDWDFGYLGAPTLDHDRLFEALAAAVGSEALDLVDLARAGGLLRYRAARDGRAVVENEAGSFERFWLEAVRFWCDAAPVLGPAYEGVLERLGR